MIRSDDPAPIGFALDAAHESAHGLQAADVRLRERLAGLRVETKVRIDVVATAIRGGDGSDRPIDLADAARLRLDTDDGALVQRLDRIAPADADIVAAAIGSVSVSN